MASSNGRLKSDNTTEAILMLVKIRQITQMKVIAAAKAYPYMPLENHYHIASGIGHVSPTCCLSHDCALKCESLEGAMATGKDCTP